MNAIEALDRELARLDALIQFWAVRIGCEKNLLECMNRRTRIQEHLMVLASNEK